ncbi:MAG TPA: branched-chain amino acid transaminase [Candidatus Sumerlaeota bacterium]|nr:branched-chain amino acid transaminase [Candidatus Sumerlaeota bacterium]
MTFGKGKIWFDGKFIPWEECTIHALSHVVHYGSGIFEGIRCYKNSKGSAIYRLREHIRRLYESAKIYRIDIPYTQDQMCQACVDTVRENNLAECYIRPLVFRGYGELGVNPSRCPVQSLIAVWSWGKYLGPEALENGVSVCISSWRRAAPNTFPTLAKACGNYMNSQLIKMEALRNGYDEGIALDPSGYISEGSGENIFIVRSGVIYTPPSSSSILPGITRHAVFQIARTLGLRIEQHLIPREALYISDEIFFTGTAAEITPVTKVDKITVGEGKRGPITKAIQDFFFGVVNGEADDTFKWLTYV